MSGTRTGISRVGVLMVIAGLALWTVEVLAHSGGVAGVTTSTTGCSCHGSAPNQNGALTVSITGPLFVIPGSTSSYTISVAGGPAGTTGGVDVSATGGTLIAGTGTKILTGEAVHSNNARRSWTFNWQAPAAEGSYGLYAVGMASNGGGSSGDSWNWYGDAVRTPFTVTVSSLVGVGGGGAAELSFPAATPNPSSGPTQLRFSLPVPAPVRLDVFDCSGRLVCRLLDGPFPAGTWGVVWQGADERGARVPSGRYLVRLSAGGRTLTRSVTMLR